MLYSDLYLRPKQNKILGIAAVAVILIFGIFIYFSRANSIPSNAENKVLKKQLLVNLSSHQVSVFWISDKKESGWVLFGTGKDNLKLVASDERDLGDAKSNRFLHYATLKGLDENTTYYYKIVSGNQVALAANKQSFSFKTPISTSQTSSIKPAYGKVSLTNGKPAQEAFVFYYYKNAVPFLTLTKLTGEWLIPLQYAISQTTNEVIPINEKETVHIDIMTDDNEETNIDALVSKTNPLPQTIVLGKDYKFLEEDNVLPASTKRVVENKDYPVAIILPRENALIPGAKPLLKGQGIPGKPVKIQINSKPGYISRITVNDKGEWKVEVPVSLIAGSYMMTVSTEDKDGGAVNLTRKFAIAKSGEQVLGEATPSAVVSPTNSPTPLPTTAIPSPSITISLSPTVTIPIFTATPVSSATATIITPIPSLGFDNNNIVYGSIGFIVIGVGLMMIF